MNAINYDFLFKQVGLAVDNIKGTLDGAVVKRRALQVAHFMHFSSLPFHFLYYCTQVELVLNVEEVLPICLRRYFIIGSREIRPNRILSLLDKCTQAWGRGERYDSYENISNALRPPLVSFLPIF